MPRRLFWLWFSAIILVAALLVVGKLYFSAYKISGGFAAPTVAPLNTSHWTVYANSEFGISLKYPPGWQRSADVLSVADPHVFFGNPLDGTTTYDLKLFVYNNPQDLSAKDFVARILAGDMAGDASNSAAGPAPQMTPQFDSQYTTTVGSYPAYELYNVFEFDHNGEEIYVQQNKKMIVFDFPVTGPNPNLALPAENNTVAHEIVNTLTLDPNGGR